jgi:hypothetical protein
MSLADRNARCGTVFWLAGRACIFYLLAVFLGHRGDRLVFQINQQHGHLESFLRAFFNADATTIAFCRINHYVELARTV